jgi:hypothetical protein
MTSYVCPRCDYNTTLKQKYMNHLKRKNKCKPLKSEDDLKKEYEKYLSPSKAQYKTFKCEHCTKTLSTKQVLQKHLLVCKKKLKKDEEKSEKNALETVVNALNNHIAMQNEQIKKQSEQIEQLIKRSGNSYDQSINVNVQMNAFNANDMASLTDKEIIGCMKKNNMCIPALIEKVHLNPRNPRNRNIYISNFRNNYVMVYDGSKWNLTDNKFLIDELIDGKHFMLEQKISEWIVDNQYSEVIGRFNKYLDAVEDDITLNEIKNKIKHMLYNNRDLVISYGQNTSQANQANEANHTTQTNLKKID